MRRLHSPLGVWALAALFGGLSLLAHALHEGQGCGCGCDVAASVADGRHARRHDCRGHDHAQAPAPRTRLCEQGWRTAGAGHDRHACAACALLAKLKTSLAVVEEDFASANVCSSAPRAVDSLPPAPPLRSCAARGPPVTAA